MKFLHFETSQLHGGVNSKEAERLQRLFFVLPIMWTFTHAGTNVYYNTTEGSNQNLMEVSLNCLCSHVRSCHRPVLRPGALSFI